MSRRAQAPAVALILLLGAALRFHRLDEIPPGLTHDEASVGFFARQVVLGRPFEIDAPYGYANEPFTQYAAALLMRLVGPSDWALRAHQAVWGLAAVLATYLWARRAFGVPTGLLASALMAVSYWPLATSRFALNSNPTPGLLAAAVYLMWVGLFGSEAAGGGKARRMLAWAGFAVCMAGSLYAYEAARAAWLSLPLFWLYLAITRFDRRRLIEFALAIGAGAGFALPHLTDPAAWGRTNTLSTPLAAARAGDPGPLLRNALEGVGTLAFRGDPFIVYNRPGRPVFDPVTGMLFAFGLLTCLRCIRRPACAFALLWLGAGILPTLVIGAFTSSLHSIAAQPVIFALPALAATRLAARRSSLATVLLPGLIAATAALTFRDYFYRWAQDPAMRAAYFANFGAVTRYLHGVDYSGAVALSSPFPGLPHDPFAADLRIRRDDLDVRWFDAREALVFPNAEESLLVLPVNAWPDPLFAAHLPLAAADRHEIRPDDVDPYFDTLLWRPQAALATWLAAAEIARFDPPVEFGGAVELAAYWLEARLYRPGEELRALTFWRILDPRALGERDITEYSWRANIFLHLLAGDGALAAQRDSLQAPAWDWHAGDWFAQIHRLDLPHDLPPGEYRLSAGVYTLPSLVRLETPAGDVAWLGEVRVVAP